MDEINIEVITLKILEIIDNNIDGMGFKEVIKESELYQEDDFDVFYSAIGYDIKKMLRKE